MSFYSATMTPQTLGNTGHQSIDNRNYHLVLVTKYRRTGLTGPLRDRREDPWPQHGGTIGARGAGIPVTRILGIGFGP